MTEWQPLGKHLMRVEGDLVATIWRGEVELAEVQTLFALYGQVHDQHGRVFILSDMRHSGVPPEKARRWMANWLREQRKLTGAAAYGANVVIRAVFIMLLRGIRLFGVHIPFGIFATESEARAFIDQLRLETPSTK
jgi:hypothetical protein